jgi:hypothetical protein
VTRAFSGNYDSALDAGLAGVIAALAIGADDAVDVSPSGV